MSSLFSLPFHYYEQMEKNQENYLFPDIRIPSNMALSIYLLFFDVSQYTSR